MGKEGGHLSVSESLTLIMPSHAMCNKCHGRGECCGCQFHVRTNTIRHLLKRWWVIAIAIYFFLVSLNCTSWHSLIVSQQILQILCKVANICNSHYCILVSVCKDSVSKTRSTSPPPLRWFFCPSIPHFLHAPQMFPNPLIHPLSRRRKPLIFPPMLVGISGTERLLEMQPFLTSHLLCGFRVAGHWKRIQ